MYNLFIKPLFFLLPAEKAHYFTVDLLKLVLAIPGIRWVFRQLYHVSDSRLERNYLGLRFPNPVGLAAGFDKDGKSFQAMSALGFGFIEIGTVTPKPQSGNDKPRLFRLPTDQGLINRMGFNNEGVEAMVSRLRQRKQHSVIIGGNIGKNKVTPNDDAHKDYLYCFDKLFELVDYFVVNVSSPNTPDLRELQDKEPLTKLLQLLQTENQKRKAPKPILLKIAPDLTNGQLDDIIQIVQSTQIDGVIATNTTISRADLSTSSQKISAIGNGGLSGRPLTNRATEVIRYLYEQSDQKLFIIGVGGIRSAQDALDKLAAGAKLIQVYSGMIFEGPTLIKSINQGILSQSGS